MAGAGYKLFATGDVLTAAQVNTYLMQQTVMVFASSAARTSALSGVLAEGMVSYLQDTNTLEVYDGAAWVGATGDITGLTAGTGISISSATGPVPTVAIDTAVTADLTTAQTLTNKTLTSPVLTTPSISNINAKGDILVGTADNTLGIITAGSNGDTLVADSSTSTGLRYTSNFAAGKNKIINGDCNINQRNFSSGTATGQYILDRFQDDGTGGTITTSIQQFTPGTAPVAGYEAKQFMRTITATQSAAGHYDSLTQAIEDVRTLAGQTVTVSFWAKAASGTPNIGISLSQNFGSGGSPSIISSAAVQTITTSWARYSFTLTLPSISGKTIGTSSFVKLYIFVSVGSTIQSFGYPAVGLQNNTFDVWGVQVEAGSVATAFQTATGTLQGELSAAQRYYQRYTVGVNQNTGFTTLNYSTTAAIATLPMKVTMRVAPTVLDYSNILIYDSVNAFTITGLQLWAAATTDTSGLLATGATGMTQFRGGVLTATASGGYIGLSAEL
jgi:hypothetical protein